MMSVDSLASAPPFQYNVRTSSDVNEQLKTGEQLGDDVPLLHHVHTDLLLTHKLAQTLTHHLKGGGSGGGEPPCLRHPLAPPDQHHLAVVRTHHAAHTQRLSQQRHGIPELHLSVLTERGRSTRPVGSQVVFVAGRLLWSRLLCTASCREPLMHTFSSSLCLLGFNSPSCGSAQSERGLWR
ncbi:hypothetical protein EYF80_044316 [Liparis tanakae]|uniref:Uncharacterized protein n=1 Tax=Liparis tanakae TaxID=230148 RepID=A0A4Z2FW52_9TELE|nr:hypothetical protein EYF80_044316 [Liparis tanakae]